MLSQPELIIPWACLTLYKVKGFTEIKHRWMEPQKQVRVDTLLPDFCFQGLWRLSNVDGVGSTLTHPPA